MNLDFRSKYPFTQYWPAEALRNARPPARYGDIVLVSMFEITAPDGTEFLALLNPGPKDEETGNFYGIEAPKSCPMRCALENGQISWFDYWHHKDWLISIEFNIYGGNGHTSYISPRELPEFVCERLIEAGSFSPYELKLQELELGLHHCDKSSEFGGPSEVFEDLKRQYSQFIQQYGHLLPSLKAS